MGLFDFLSGLFGGGDERDDETATTERTDAGASSPSDDDVKDVTAFGPAEFRAEAEEFADDHEEQDFDFSVASLERLDEYAASQTQVLDILGEEMGEDNELVGGAREGYVLWFGSYFGEVLVRQRDGEWVTDGDGVHVAVPVDGAVAEVPVLDVAAVAVTEEPQFAESAANLEVFTETADAPTADDGTGTDALPDADEPFPEVDLDPGMDVEQAHERAVETFESAGYHVTEGTLMNSVSDGPAGSITRLFNFQTAAEMHTGVVYTGEWDDADVNDVLSLLLTLRTDVGLDGVHLVSVREPPASMQYLSGSHPRGAFALDAMAAVQNGPALSPDSVPHYADAGRDLLDEYFDTRIDVETRDSLERLDEIVLEQLRTVDHPAETEAAYSPTEGLVTVGALAGEVMQEAFEAEFGASAEWVTDESVSSTGVAMQVTPGDGGDGMTVNPIGKAFKLFESGESDSLDFLYETSSRVLTDELA